jgi:hypothetical protein
MQKTYIGLDGISRPGAFFSHLLTDLPTLPSPCAAGQIPFSAREAIALWHSSLWYASEDSLSPGKRDLDPISDAALRAGTYAGPLNAQAVLRISTLFEQVLLAFLTLARSTEKKRLYLVGNPETVATLIWGLTHALPRTLTCMRNMTFSTFESDVETDAKPLIVGISWPTGHLKKGRENAVLDLPELYYQSDNTYGFAFNCNNPQKHTPFTPSELMVKYTRYVRERFAEGPTGATRLTWLLDKAEELDITEVDHFLRHYIQRSETLDKNAVSELLSGLHQKIKARIEQAITTLRTDKQLPTIIDEAGKLISIQAEAEVLTQDNVQQSIISLMAQDPLWWSGQGQPLIKGLYELTRPYDEKQLDSVCELFFQRIEASKQWQRNQGLDLTKSLQSFLRDTNNTIPPRELLWTFVQHIKQYILRTKQELKNAFIPLAVNIANQLVQTIRLDQQATLHIWHQGLELYIDGNASRIEVWTPLLQLLSTNIRYTETYKVWWEKYRGTQRIEQLRQRANTVAESSLSSALSNFASTAAQELVNTLRNTPAQTDTAAVLFWGELFAASAPPQSEPDAWNILLNALGTIPYTTLCDQWYQRSGKTGLKKVANLISQQPESNLQKSFRLFTNQTSSSLREAIRNDQAAELDFRNTILVQVAPHERAPLLWLQLLEELRMIATTPGFIRWWNMQGQKTTHDLRGRVDTRSLSPDLLLSFAQASVNQLVVAINEEALQKQQHYIPTIRHLLQILDAAVPAQDATIWNNLLRILASNHTYRYTDWELRSLLLKTWQTTPSLQTQEAQTNLRLWLEVSWSDLGQFLALGLPADWNSVAIIKALDSYRMFPSTQVHDVVKANPYAFEEVIQTLMKSPAHQLTIIEFFRLLATNNYMHKLRLLDQLVTASSYQKDLVEQLLQAANIKVVRDIVDLLENHCQVLITSYELPRTMLDLLENYLKNFDVGYINADPTQKLLRQLLQRQLTPALQLPTHIYQSVAGWYSIAQFLLQPQATSDSLRALDQNIHNMVQPLPDIQKKLLTTLLPHLVELVASEADLTRVLDNLGRGAERQLLQDMATAAGEKYGQDDPPYRIAVYARTILAEGCRLPSIEKETFINTCFLALFKGTTSQVRDKYLPEPLWSPNLAAEWQKALLFLKFMHAIDEPALFEIARLFQPVYEHYLDEQDLNIVRLATSFVQAYHANDAQTVLQTTSKLKNYYSDLRLTAEQEQRVKQMRQGPTSPIVSGRLAMSTVLNDYPPPNPQVAPHQSYEGQSVQPQGLYATRTTQSEQQQIVATVKERKILLEDLESTIENKRTYLGYRIKKLDYEIAAIERGNTAQQKADPKPKKEERYAIKTTLQSKNNDKFRYDTLEELIDHILFQDEINNQIAQKQINMQFYNGFEEGIHTELVLIYDDMVKSSGWNKPSSTVETITKKTLYMLIKRRHFEAMVYRQQDKKLEVWLKERRSREKDYIHVNYVLARVTPPHHGWRRFLPMDK